MKMFNVPLLFFQEKEMEDEVKKLNNERTVQVSDTTMLRNKIQFVTKKLDIKCNVRTGEHKKFFYTQHQ